MAEHTPTQFEIMYRNGAYYVSIPNYHGGKVYTEEVVDPLINALRNARNYIDSVIINTPDKKKRRNFGECLRIIEAALMPVGGPSFDAPQPDRHVEGVKQP